MVCGLLSNFRKEVEVVEEDGEATSSVMLP